MEYRLVKELQVERTRKPGRRENRSMREKNKMRMKMEEEEGMLRGEPITTCYLILTRKV